jgi:hypothetical protein
MIRIASAEHNYRETSNGTECDMGWHNPKQPNDLTMDYELKPVESNAQSDKIVWSCPCGFPLDLEFRIMERGVWRFMSLWMHPIVDCPGQEISQL